MKRVLIMSTLLFSRILVAQDFSVDSLMGESWYGLYLNGEKAGYSVNNTSKDETGNIVLVEDAQFQINMVGVKQDMHIFSKRVYAPTGELLRIDSTVTDPAGTSEFNAVVEGDQLRLVSIIGGAPEEVVLPRPKESLADAVKHARWVLGQPAVGDTLNFTEFEPMYQKEVSGMSRIVEVEERILNGIKTRVYTVKTSLDIMGIEVVSHIDESGTTLEDVVAGIIVMRLEPEAMAKDVNYSNDVIVSNAALIDTPITNPRGRTELELLLDGPLSKDHLFNDERQFIEARGDSFRFVAHQVSLDDFEPATLPIENEEVAHWLKPTVFVQSESPKLAEKAREIVGEETNSLEVSRKLCRWVNENMRSTFSARLTNALEVLASLEGDCTEHSILFIGLARAAGLPAREVAGLVYVEGSQPGFYFHQWAKVWVGKWIDVDPTFNQPLADVTHIKLAEGDLFNQARLIPIIGNLKIRVPEQAAAADAAQKETPTAGGDDEAKKAS